MPDSRILQLPEGTPGPGKWGVMASAGANERFDMSAVSGSVSVTYAEAQTLIGDEALSRGQNYFISDKNVFIKAMSTTEFAFEGFGRFDMPDYSTIDVWVSDSGGGSYSATDKVAYNGIVWENLTGTNTDTAPPSDGTNWSQTPYNETDYLREWDTILYSFDDDLLFGRKDKRGNEVVSSISYANSNDPVGNFQWGNDDVSDNYVLGSKMVILNQAGEFTGNTFLGGSLTGTVAEGFTGTFEYNNINNQSTINLSGGTTATIQQCVYDNQATVVHNAQTSNLVACTFKRDMTDSSDIGAHTNKILEEEYSTFSKTVDISQTISDFPTTTTLEIASNVSTLFKSGDTVHVVGSTSNDGTYTLSMDASFGGGVTTLTITTTWSVEAGAGTVTGERADVDDSASVFGFYEIESDYNSPSLVQVFNVNGSNDTVFYSENGNELTIQHTAVGSVSSGEITLIGGSNVTLTGRSDIERSDFIRLRRSSTFIREIYNSVLQ